MNAIAETTGQELAPSTTGKFQKGKSGNPKGRPKGARNKATMAAEALLDGDATLITKKAIELAKSGDMTAIRLCLERVLPPRKCRPLQITLPGISKPEDLLTAVNSIASAVAGGRITIDEAEGLLRFVEAARKAIETEELYRELEEVKSRLEVVHGKIA